MASLRTLSIKENPFCEESDDWEGFVMAMLQVRINKLKVACDNPDYLSACMVWHLQDLAYLECHRVDPARREEAAVRYQGDIFRIRNDEDQVRGHRL